MGVRGTLAIVVGVPIGVVGVFVTMIVIMPMMVILDTGLAFTAAANRTHYSNSCCLILVSDPFSDPIESVSLTPAGLPGPQAMYQRLEKRQPFDYINLTTSFCLWAPYPAGMMHSDS